MAEAGLELCRSPQPLFEIASLLVVEPGALHVLGACSQPFFIETGSQYN